MTSTPFDPSRIGRGLAFASAIDDLSAALDRSPSVVVSAPPGTGKTTLVPPLVADRVQGRYARLVKEMSQTVQFIYITHNKIAMEMADRYPCIE